MRLTTTLSDEARAAHIAARRKGSALWRFIHKGGSLHLAMILLVTIALACAVATVAESRFDGEVARRYIYKAPWFLVWLGVLCFNLLCVTLTRWPWQRQHLGFVITHYGIITLLAGAVIGRTFGFEGFMDLEVGQPPTRMAVLQQQVIQVDLPAAGLRQELALDAQARLPSPARPWTLNVPGTDTAVRFGDYAAKMMPEEVLLGVMPGKPGIALRFESGMMRQGLTRVLQPTAERRVSDFFGLARVEWADDFSTPIASPLPTLRLHPRGDGTEIVDYQLCRDGKPVSRGTLKPGDPLTLGWADWQAKLISSLSSAVVAIQAAPASANAPDASPGLLVSTLAGGKVLDGPEWLLSGDRRDFRTANGVPLRVAFGLKTRRLPFTVELLKFRVPRDEGTDNPSDFIGTLRFDDGAGNVRVGEAHMNYPASYPGQLWRSMLGRNYKFSQTSWNPQNLNETTLQLLYDPGWPLKWIGSLLIVTGIVLLFYFRPKKKSAAPDSPAPALVP